MPKIRLNINKDKDMPRTSDPEKCFWFADGSHACDLDELHQAIEQMCEEQFSYYCNDSKNDFSVWIADVLGDAKFAKRIAKVNSRVGALRSITARIKRYRK